ncbi:MAG: hypothetical protein VX801_05575 [Gemmatimonadota bacterium]|jgi:hypothetical protein|nr:hypothetical protein [Gemmatimonadota bacterium]|tara:strand:+ start:3001 stop:3255 length:255 start_codon:yes stop_codon:yes gene_type:complete
MRNRERVLQSLEKVYRAAFAVTEDASDSASMARLDLEYQRDQLHLEVLLDIRDLLLAEEPDTVEKTKSLLEKARDIRQLTKLRP